MVLKNGVPSNNDAYIACNMCGRTNQDYSGEGELMWGATNAAMAAHVASHSLADQSAYLLRLQLGLGPVVLTIRV